LGSADAFALFSAEDESFFTLSEDAEFAGAGLGVVVLIRVVTGFRGALALAVGHVEIKSIFASLFIAFAIANVFVPREGWAALAWRALALTLVLVPVLIQVVL